MRTLLGRLLGALGLYLTVAVITIAARRQAVLTGFPRFDTPESVLAVRAALRRSDCTLLRSSLGAHREALSAPAGSRQGNGNSRAHGRRPRSSTPASSGPHCVVRRGRSVGQSFENGVVILAPLIDRACSASHSPLGRGERAPGLAFTYTRLRGRHPSGGASARR